MEQPGRFDLRILVLASEVVADEALLERWSRVDPNAAVRLIVYPDAPSTMTDQTATAALLDRQKVTPHVRATVLSGPLAADARARLLIECAGFLGDGEIPAAVRGLRRLTDADLDELIAGTQPTLEVALIGGGDRVFHRGTEADVGTIKQIFQLEEYSFAMLEPWLGDATPVRDRQQLIVDCGANIGASVLYFARAFPDARIVALEPEPGNFALLERNSAPLAHVQLLRNAIGATAGTMRLVDPEIGEWGYRVGADAEGVDLGSVEVLTIDDVLAHAGDCEPFVLKVDIEGGEQDLFGAHGESLNRFPIVIVELHDWMLRGKDVSGPFLDWHRRFGRELRTIGENLFSLDAGLGRR